MTRRSSTLASDSKTSTRRLSTSLELHLNVGQRLSTYLHAVTITGSGWFIRQQKKASKPHASAWGYPNIQSGIMSRSFVGLHIWPTSRTTYWPTNPHNSKSSQRLGTQLCKWCVNPISKPLPPSAEGIRYVWVTTSFTYSIINLRPYERKFPHNKTWLLPIELCFPS